MAKNVAAVAAKRMRETNDELIWRGDYGQLHEIASEAKVKSTHPINVIAAVMSCIAKSPLFERYGSINHNGRNCPVYKLLEETRP